MEIFQGWIIRKPLHKMYKGESSIGISLKCYPHTLSWIGISFKCYPRIKSSNNFICWLRVPKKNEMAARWFSLEIGVVILLNIVLILSYSQAKESALATIISWAETSEKSTLYPAIFARYSMNNLCVLPFPSRNGWSTFISLK